MQHSNFAQDSILAMAGSGSAVAAYQIQNPDQSIMHPLLGQILVPIVMGILVPYLKEYLAIKLQRMKEKKHRKNDSV